MWSCPAATTGPRLVNGDASHCAGIFGCWWPMGPAVSWLFVRGGRLAGGGQWIVKPDSVALPNRKRDGHSSCPVIAHGVQRPYPRVSGGRPDPPIWSCSRWGLPCVRHHWRTGELLPHLFNLTRRSGANRSPPGGVFSVALSLDRSRPPLAATLSCGVRTFLLRVLPRKRPSDPLSPETQFPD